jgi:3-hydroxybutyrate dehydrogenase
MYCADTGPDGVTAQSHKKVALVTGAAGGIGEAIGAALRHDDWLTYGVDLKPCDGFTDSIAVDLATRRGNRAAIDGAIGRFGRLDAIVANAGLQQVAPVDEMPEDTWDLLIALLLTSPFLLAKYGWSHLKRSEEGRFIAMASVHGHVASPFKAPYVSAKHGVLGLVKTMALEGAEDGIAAVAVCPGYVRTPLVEGQLAEQARTHGIPVEQVLSEVLLRRQAVKRLIEPAEVAAAVAYLASPHGASFTGGSLDMDLGWTAS